MLDWFGDYWYNSTRTVAVHKHTGVAWRKYHRLRKGKKITVVWKLVDGITFTWLPSVKPRRVPEENRKLWARTAPP